MTYPLGCISSRPTAAQAKKTLSLLTARVMTFTGIFPTIALMSSVQSTTRARGTWYCEPGTTGPLIYGKRLFPVEVLVGGQRLYICIKMMSGDTGDLFYIPEIDKPQNWFREKERTKYPQQSQFTDLTSYNVKANFATSLHNLLRSITSEWAPPTHVQSCLIPACWHKNGTWREKKKTHLGEVCRSKMAVPNLTKTEARWEWFIKFRSAAGSGYWYLISLLCNLQSYKVRGICLSCVLVVPSPSPSNCYHTPRYVLTVNTLLNCPRGQFNSVIANMLSVQCYQETREKIKALRRDIMLQMPRRKGQRALP